MWSVLGLCIRKLNNTLTATSVKPISLELEGAATLEFSVPFPYW